MAWRQLWYELNNSRYCISTDRENAMERYFGTYQTFRTASKKEAAALVGSDNLIGDCYSIDCTIEQGIQKAWLVNRFGSRVGFFDPDFSRELNLKKAQGMTLTGVLSFVAFSEDPEPGEYWGNAAIIGYDPADAATMETFIKGVAGLIAKGIRPKLSFEGYGVDQIFESGGTWLPSDRVPLPEKQRGMAILKKRRSLTDSLVEQGRAGNKGCYILSWAFLLAIVALIIFGLKACGVF